MTGGEPRKVNREMDRQQGIIFPSQNLFAFGGRDAAALQMALTLKPRRATSC